MADAAESGSSSNGAPAAAPSASGMPAQTPPNNRPAASATPGSNPKPGGNMAKAQAQMQKLRDANGKYKNLLKMAKERIQAQEEELDKLRAEAKKGREDLAMEKVRNAELRAENDAIMDGAVGSGMGGAGMGGGMGGNNGGGPGGAGGGPADMGESDPNSQTVIVRVCQRIKMENDKMNNATANGGGSRRPVSYTHLTLPTILRV